MRARLVLVLVACGGAYDSQQRAARPLENVGAPRTDDPVVIEIERTTCYGECPAHRLTITAAGRVEYLGKSSVKIQGFARSSISTAKVRKLGDAFEAIDFARLAASLTERMPHFPEIRLRYRGQEIRHLGGVYADHREATVEQLAEAIDRAVGDVLAPQVPPERPCPGCSGRR